jgi:hydrogenase/urease accessory protein HupE
MKSMEQAAACRPAWLLLCLLVACLGLPSLVLAHDARPVAVTLIEVLPSTFQASLRVPPTVEPQNFPSLVWPAGCERLTGDEGALPLWRCPTGLAGTNFSLRFPQFNPSLATFYRIEWLERAPQLAILPPTAQGWQVPEADGPAKVLREYSLLGIEHILFGYDHLLFVLGLLVIARTWRRILLTVTGFTLAHSITLSLSSLGWLQVPIAPVEATIALSIVFLAVEISRPRHHPSLTYQYPVLVSFSFGLLHGLGFASALGEIGLAENQVLLSLLFFNIGVELGQLAFILAVGGLALLVTAWGLRHLPAATRERLRWQADRTASYVIGVPATYWLLERLGG